MSIKKIILTGFMPFGGYGYNPVQESTRHFHGMLMGRFKRRSIIGLVLPCTYYGAFKLLADVIDAERPAAIVSTGLSSSARGIRIETLFRNVMDGKYPDEDGYSPSHVPIKVIARDFYEPTADSLALSEALRARGIPTELSSDADAFVCNSLGYLTSRKIANERLPITNTFIHVPWTDDYSDRVSISPEKIYLKKELFYESLELILNII